MGEKATMFLLDKFNAGLTGHKADPLQVAKEMKLSKNKDGNPLFFPEEWLSAKQITSFFSRMSALHKQHYGDRKWMSKNWMKRISLV